MTEARLSAMLDATACVVLLVDAVNGKVRDLNRPTEQLTEFLRDELLDRPLWDTIMAPEDRPAMRASYFASVEAGMPLSYECTVKTRSGGRLRMLWSGAFLDDQKGSRSHLVLTGVDVTSRESTGGVFGHLMRAATTTAFVATDLTGRVTFYSSGAERLLGRPASEVLGRVFPVSCFEPVDFQSRAKAIGVPSDLALLDLHRRRHDRRSGREFDFGIHDRRSHVPQQGGPQDPFEGPSAQDWTMLHRDGTRIVVSISIVRVSDASGRRVGYFVVGHDVTDKRATEDLLFETLQTERVATERLRALDQAKTEFVATLSHELRTPMTSITGYTELLVDDAAGQLTEDQRAFVEAIRRNGQRLSALAGDLLTLSRHEAGTFSHELHDLDLREVVWAAHTALHPMISERDLEVTFETPSDPVIVHGDAQNLERMVSNLVGNAVKFTDEGGWVRCKLREAGGVAQLSVKDNGIGIPLEEQGHLFTRFFRASTAVDRAIQGTGLGLTVVQSIAGSHGGAISVDSAHGEGTTFTVNLPMKQTVSLEAGTSG